MSTITVTNIQATGETASRAVSGVAAAWGNFNASAATPSIRDSSNMSSITDYSAGQQGATMTSAMANITYGITDSISFLAASSTNIISTNSSSPTGTTTPTTTHFRWMSVNYGTGTPYDCDYVMVAIHGDLA